MRVMIHAFISSKDSNFSTDQKHTASVSAHSRARARVLRLKARKTAKNIAPTVRAANDGTRFYVPDRRYLCTMYHRQSRQASSHRR